MSICLRSATGADVEAICAIGRAVWPETYAFAGQDYVEHGLAAWYILPEHQGAGLGGALLRSLIEAVPPERRAVAIEYVDGNDRAAAGYARHGFVEVRRDHADRPGWPAQIWAELALPAF